MPRLFPPSILLLLGLAACTAETHEPPPPPAATVRVPDDGWIDVTASLQAGRTPVYEGDAPMVFSFL
jgi:hypothetical protein